MWINVILSIDERLEDVKACVDSLQRVFGSGCPIALATYGGKEIGSQPATRAFANVLGFPYFDIPRHDFLTEDDSREWHACETMARIQITKMANDLGVKEVYIMHADVRILGDFRPHFAQADDAWSFVAILLRAQGPLEDLIQKGSWGLYFEGNQARLADILVRYSSAYVAQLCAKYTTPKSLWQDLMSKSTLWGDLAQFDLARPWNGFTGRCIKENTDEAPMCKGTIVHQARQRLPAGVKAGIDRAGILRNYERRACAT